MVNLNYFISALKGTPEALRIHRQGLEHQPGILNGLKHLQAVTAETATRDNADQEQPIFLLSAGWRSGSTLVQRLIMSDPRVLIWGEPFDECGMIQKMAETLVAFRPGWPPEDYFYDYHKVSSAQELSTEWIANLFPGLEELRQSHRALFTTLFAEPAQKAGAGIWGIKEVRLTIEHAFYLKWLYPNARFILLYRNPLKAYQSYCRYGRSWYDTWPDKPVFTPMAFGQHWQKLLQGYIRQAEQLGGLLLCYEDLIQDNRQLDRLENYLDIEINHNLIKKKVGSSELSTGKAWVSRLEKWLLRRAVSPLAEEMGYKW